MNEKSSGNRPFLWLIDSEQARLDACADAFAPWADCLHFLWNETVPDRDTPPDAIFFSAEIPGGANGDFFAGLLESAGTVPLIAVARLRSLAQAVAYFRAGAADCLSLPLTEEEAHGRFDACVERAAKLSARIAPEEPQPPAEEPPEEEDILAQVLPPPPPAPHSPAQPDEEPDNEEPGSADASAPAGTPAPAEDPSAEAPKPAAVPEWHGFQTFVNDMPLPLGIPAREEEAAREASGGTGEIEDAPDNLLFADLAPGAEEDRDAEDEPTPVDGLPVPALWEELPCGLLLFDSLGNLVFSNRLGLELLGRDTLAALQDALQNNPASFAAHGLNHKPLPDNQWPHVLAVRTRTPRSAVVSVETGDKRRAWLRIDCQPHLADGKIARLSMTAVNLTGELPPLQTQEAEKLPPPAAPRKGKRDKAKQRGRKKG